MKLVLLITCCAAVCGTAFSFDEWVSFKAKYGKAYSGENEEHLRLGIYLSNKQRIEEHNAKYEAGLVSFKMEMNHFGDKLQDEISSLNGLNITGELETQEPKLFYSRSYDDAELPSSVDWREKGAVTHVKNQGRCGSCWAFSTTGSLEGQLFKKSGELVALSEQNLVDCASNNNGCHGGLMSLAFEFIKENDGIQSEDSYPYEGYKGDCRFRNSEVAATVSGYVSVHADEEALKEAVATIGPISVAINAGQSSFSFYREGVYDDMSCDPKNLNHGVLLVGYGTEDGQDYWLIKNSWGTAWGERGYVKIARNQNNLCGVASMAGYPLV